MDSADYANYGSAATSAAGLMQSAFGGSSYRSDNRAARKAYKYALRYQPGIDDARGAIQQKYYDQRGASDEYYRNRTIQGRVADAKKAGLHPLFALGGAIPGGGSPSSGSSPSFSMAGQTAKGDLKTEGLSRSLANIGQQETSRDIVAMQLAASALELAKQQGNDKASNLANAGVHDSRYYSGYNNPAAQEKKKGEVQAHLPNERSTNQNVISAMTTHRIGSQDIKFPAEEGADLMEDPIANVVAAMTYKGNKHVDWRKAVGDWTGNPQFWDKYNYSANRRKVLKKSLWGLVKYYQHYQIPRTMGR